MYTELKLDSSDCNYYGNTIHDLFEAKEKCYNDVNCGGVHNWSCDEKLYKLCEKEQSMDRHNIAPTVCGKKVEIICLFSSSSQGQDNKIRLVTNNNV